MSNPQNAASETLHFHVELYREGFGDAEVVFSQTYHQPYVAIQAVRAWVNFNEELIDLNYEDGVYEGMDGYIKMDREVLQSIPETWHDKSMFELRIEHPARDGRYAGGRVTACDGEMIPTAEAIEELLASVFSGAIGPTGHSPLGPHSAN